MNKETGCCFSVTKTGVRSNDGRMKVKAEGVNKNLRQG